MSTDGLVQCQGTEQEKRVRKRKKKLYAAIRQQMEFYFSDSNLARDKFLAPLIEQSEGGYVDVNIFLQFNKIRSLTTDIEDIKKALTSSEILQLSDGLSSVRRISPVQHLGNVDIATLYVENLPAHADHDWIKDIFSRFGKINFIGLPRFAISHRIKGFAFIEFDAAESVDKACKYFSSSNKSPLPLTSRNDDSSQKRTPKRQTDLADEKNEESEPPKKKKKGDPSLEENKASTEEASKEVIKESRKRKKKYKEKNEIDVSYLVVMPKKEWKRFKNKYVALQKANMAEVKKYFGSMKTDYHQVSDIAATSAKSPQFIPGVIIKVQAEEPFSNSAQIRSELKAALGVAYVDIQDHKIEGFVRCQSADVTEDILKIVESKGRASILTGKEEEEYWENVMREREAKIKSKTKVKKRGCDKIMQKAVKSMEISNKHVRFDD